MPLERATPLEKEIAAFARRLTGAQDLRAGQHPRGASRVTRSPRLRRSRG